MAGITDLPTETLAEVVPPSDALQWLGEVGQSYGVQAFPVLTTCGSFGRNLLVKSPCCISERNLKEFFVEITEGIIPGVIAMHHEVHHNRRSISKTCAGDPVSGRLYPTRYIAKRPLAVAPMELRIPYVVPEPWERAGVEICFIWEDNSTSPNVSRTETGGAHPELEQPALQTETRPP